MADGPPTQKEFRDAFSTLEVISLVIVKTAADSHGKPPARPEMWNAIQFHGRKPPIESEHPKTKVTLETVPFACEWRGIAMDVNPNPLSGTSNGSIQIQSPDQLIEPRTSHR